MNLPTPDTAAYLSAKPFPHCVVDGAIDRDLLNSVIECWPAEQEHAPKNSKNEVYKGHTTSEKHMGARIASFIMSHFESQEFIGWLEKLTGITGLLFDCRKFALHETFPGGSLKPHLDYTISKVTGLQLRVNVILYLNRDWKPEYKGDLILYEGIQAYGGVLNKPVVSIVPLFNRMVIFTMDADTPAWHGHPDPLRCPAGMSRKSIALNYFTIPERGVVDQPTIFSKSFLKEILPPILYRALIK